MKVKTKTGKCKKLKYVEVVDGRMLDNEDVQEEIRRICSEVGKSFLWEDSLNTR